LSERFPLGYHLAVNMFRQVRSESYWDSRLAETWELRTWPTKNELIAARTNPDQAILDIACGNGSILRDLKSRGYRNLHGLEISTYAVKRLQTEGIVMHHGSIPALPLPDAQYDTVIASQVLEHVIRRNQFAAEITRVLKPGGSAFVFVPNDCLGPIDEPEHVIKYNEESLHKFLARHFDIVSIDVIKDANHAMSILFAHVHSRRRKG
jgi:2-polyprenyl-3-methyl-5-hydroxy-6-metoxy-1,4-benzoquinol methylase